MNLLYAPFPIKFLPEVTTVIFYLAETFINTGSLSNGCIFVARLCANRITKIKVIYYDESFIPAKQYCEKIDNNP